MTRQEAQHILDTIKFPFVRFTTKDNPFGDSPDSILILMVAKLPDNDKPGEIITITQDRVISTMIDQEHFVIQIWTMLMDWLKHEAGELFEIGGAFPFNEHKEYTKEARLMKAVFTRPDIVELKGRPGSYVYPKFPSQIRSLATLEINAGTKGSS